MTSAWSVEYASPYRGSGRGIYTSSPIQRSAASVGVAQAPVAAMGSVSRGVAPVDGTQGYASMRTITTAVSMTQSARGIYTAASSVTGGVTTNETGGKPRGRVRKTTPEPTSPVPTPDTPGSCPGCVGHYKWDPDGNAGDGDWYCMQCEHYLTEGCTCAEEDGYCWCPLDLNWGAVLFLALLAAGYAMWKGKDRPLQLPYRGEKRPEYDSGSKKNVK